MRMIGKYTKRLVLFLVAGVAGMVGTGCSGTDTDSGEPAGNLTLTVDKRDLTADGLDAVNFTVTLDGTDITTKADIRCVTNNEVLAEATFSTTEPGDYVFEAEYDGVSSRQISVKAVPGEEPEGPSKFQRRICVMEFTGTWCAMCPAGYQTLNYYATNNAKYKGLIDIIALHGQSGDPFEIPVMEEIHQDFGNLGFPAFVTDLRESGLLNNDLEQKLKKSLEASVNDYPAHCGVALQSVYDEAAGKANVTVSVSSEKSVKYRVAIYVVENTIRYEQNNGGQYIKDYIHDHVARKLLSASYKGDDLGMIMAGEESSKTYEVTLEDTWNKDELWLVAMAIDPNGYVNNVNSCRLVNGKSDYILSEGE